jgi:hypothetical protein
MTETKLIATLNYTALTLSRRVKLFKKMQEENSELNIDKNIFLNDAIRRIEESLKVFKRVI